MADGWRATEQKHQKGGSKVRQLVDYYFSLAQQ